MNCSGLTRSEWSVCENVGARAVRRSIGRWFPKAAGAIPECASAQTEQEWLGTWELPV